MRKALRIVLVLGSLAASLMILACSDSSAPPGYTSSPQPATAGDESPSAPPAAVVEPTTTPDPTYDLSLITPVLPAEPLAPVDTLVGAPDRSAAEAITEAMVAAGFDLHCIEFFVFPLPSGEQNLLVIDRQLQLEVEVVTGDETTADAGADPMLVGLVASQAFESANIGRVVYNLHYLDDQGAELLIAVVTQPASTFVASVTGAITQEEALAATHLEIRQVGPQ